MKGCKGIIKIFGEVAHENYFSKMVHGKSDYYFRAIKQSEKLSKFKGIEKLKKENDVSIVWELWERKL